MLRSVSVKNAIKDALEIFQFDQWVRFYFTVDKDGGMRIEIPEDKLRKIEEQSPVLFRFADMVNDAPLDYKRSQDNVCSFVASRLDGEKYEPTVLPQVFDDVRFKVEMYLFNVWQKMHEPHLDEEYLDFSEWMEMYEGWNSLDEVKEYRTKLLQSGTDPQVPACDTAQ